MDRYDKIFISATLHEYSVYDFEGYMYRLAKKLSDDNEECEENGYIDITLKYCRNRNKFTVIGLRLETDEEYDERIKNRKNKKSTKNLKELIEKYPDGSTTTNLS